MILRDQNMNRLMMRATYFIRTGCRVTKPLHVGPWWQLYPYQIELDLGSSCAVPVPKWSERQDLNLRPPRPERVEPDLRY